MIKTHFVLKHLLFSSKTITRSLSTGIFKATLPKMSKPDGDYSGMHLGDIIERLESFAAPTLAEGWDNVGLLIDPMVKRNIKNILLTNDLTENVVEEATGKNVGLIVSYHPPVFKALKTINGRTWKERLVINCIKDNIAVYSPHTSWDVVTGGVNDWLAKAFDVISSQPITETGCGRRLELSKPLKISEALYHIKRHIGIPHVQLALAVGKNPDPEITTVALCAGSGATVLNGVKADLYLTGEMSHHEVLDAVQNGISVVLCNHSNTERGFLTEFAPKLQTGLLNGQVQVLVSAVDKDPLTVI